MRGTFSLWLRARVLNFTNPVGPLYATYNCASCKQVAKDYNNHACQVLPMECRLKLFVEFPILISTPAARHHLTCVITSSFITARRIIASYNWNTIFHLQFVPKITILLTLILKLVGIMYFYWQLLLYIWFIITIVKKKRSINYHA